MVGVRAVLADQVAALMDPDALAAMEDLDGPRSDAHIDFLAVSACGTEYRKSWTSM